MLKSRFVRLLALATATLACLPSLGSAATTPLTLGGTTDTDIWSNFGQYSVPTLPFPGTGAWPTTSPKTGWTTHTYTPANTTTPVTVGAIRSASVDSATGGLGDALLYKVRNGAGGGPYPASGSIYFGGFSGDANVDGGTLGVVDTTPIAGLKTIAFQVEIGEATGYDFFNDVLPTLTYTTEDGTVTIGATHSGLLSQIYTGEIFMPTGFEDINVNTWGLQYNLAGVTKPILSYELNFTGVQHAQVYGLQLDQSSTTYANNVFPQDKVWVGTGANSLWGTTGNWQGSLVPTSTEKVAFTGSGQAILDTDRSANKVTLNASSGFTISGPGTLTLGNGGIAATSTTPATYTISSKINSNDFHIIDLADNNTLNLTGNINSKGFYKKGDGDLYLTGNNTFTSGTFNQLIFKGGNSYVSGVNTAVGSSFSKYSINVKESTLTLHGGDDRFGPNLILDLVSTAFYDAAGTTLVKSGTGHLVLGDSSSRSNQTFEGIRAARTSAFNEGAAASYNLATSASTIKNGNGTLTTLTSNVSTYGDHYEFWGKIGGNTAAENNISFVKKGQGTQALGGANTYSGDTIIERGDLAFMNAAALSPHSNVKVLSGALISIGSSFNINLGTGPGQVQLLGDSGFGAVNEANTPPTGIPQALTLNGGAQIVWGSTAGFIRDGNKLLFGANSSSSNLTTVNFTNNLALGSKTREISVTSNSANPSAQISGVISGTGGLNKTGSGILELTGTNTYTGPTIVNQGVLRLQGVNSHIVSDVDVRGFGQLVIANTATANTGNKIADTAKVTLNGTTINFSNPTTNPAAAATTGIAYSETIGQLHLKSGANTVATSRVGLNTTTLVGNTSTFTLNSITRAKGATVNFSGGSLGLDTRNIVRITGQANGFVSGWATVGNSFINYGANGVTAALVTDGAFYNLNAESTWTNTSNVFSAFTSGDVALTGNRSTNSIVAQGNASTAKTFDLAGNTLTVQSGGILTYTGGTTAPVSFNNGTIKAGTTGDAELFVHANGVTAIGATIADNSTGKTTLVKTGNSTLTTTGTQTYSGGTYVNAGVLNANGTHTGGGELVVANNGTLNVNGSILVDSIVTNGTIGGNGTITWAANATLSGSGTFNKAITVGTGAGQIAKLAPGNSPGTLNTVSQTWASGGTYLMELNSANGSAGATWDHTNITGRLDITATDLNKFTIDVASLTGANEAGLLADFNKYTSYSWTIATASEGIFGFNANAFILDLTDFQNDTSGDIRMGAFSVVQTDANNLSLYYLAAVPEPGKAVLLLLGLAIATMQRRRRK